MHLQCSSCQYSFLLLAWLLISFEESGERERKLAVAAAVDNERSEAARMLHDGIGQQLVAITMSLSGEGPENHKRAGCLDGG